MKDTITLTTTGPMSGAELTFTIIGIMAGVLIIGVILRLIGLD